MKPPIDAAIQADDALELKVCVNGFGSIRNEAARALAAVAPQEVNEAAIAHQVKTEQNTAAVKRGDPELLHMSGMGAKTGVCVWDATTVRACAQRDAHAGTQRPTGLFKAAERKEWDERSARLESRATAWEKASNGLKQALALMTEQRTAKEAATVAAQNAKNAPQHSKQLDRYKALAEAEKRLQTALQPLKEKEREHGKSESHGR